MHQKFGVYIVININGAVLGSGISSRKEQALQRKHLLSNKKQLRSNVSKSNNCHIYFLF